MTKKEIKNKIKEMERVSSIDIEKEIEFNKKVNKVVLGVSIVLLSFVLFIIVMFLFGVIFKEIQDGICK